MAKRKNRPHRVVGLERNNLCPHCGRKVKNTLRLLKPEGEYVVNHWWWPDVCLSNKALIEEYLKMRLENND